MFCIFQHFSSFFKPLIFSNFFTIFSSLSIFLFDLHFFSSKFPNKIEKNNRKPIPENTWISKKYSIRISLYNKNNMSSESNKGLLADFGINSAEALSSAIVKAAESKFVHEQNISKRLVSDAIVLSATFFGSIYLLSTSIIGLNKKWIKSGCGNYIYEILNGSVVAVAALAVVFLGNKSFSILRRMQSGP